ncbi:hypothetical protein ACIO8G_02990 [Streptomyces sp. NPDC087219]|uniref:hypothetical protein n=1 Tax=Streptomyces sp. NPDC087219 TaxID=3365770 RepID=UPI0038034C64
MPNPRTLSSQDPVSVAVTAAIVTGDLDALRGLLAEHPGPADARAFGQWRAARRLLELGARPTFQDAATLGLLDQVEARLTADPVPSPEEIDEAFWGACQGGRLAVAVRLLESGADIDQIGWNDLAPLDIARAEKADEVVGRLLERGARTAEGRRAADGG